MCVSEKLTLTTAHRTSRNSTRLSSTVQEFFFDLYSRYSSLSNQFIPSKLFYNLNHFLEEVFLSSVFFSPTPRCALLHSHQVPVQWGEPHTVYAFSLTPLDFLYTLFRICTEWLLNSYALPLPGPSNGIPYVRKT